MAADSGEVKPFVDTDSSIIPYIHALPPFDVTLLPDYLDDIRLSDATAYATVLPDFQTQQRKRVIKFIRGQDQGEYAGTTTPAYSIPAMRSRMLDTDNDGTFDLTWRLGDIVYSTPTIVGTPAEDYDLLYYDRSYTDFYLKYTNRRNVVYVGANDGMLHAFNSGFYSKLEKGFFRDYDPSTGVYDNDNNKPALGAELWAYVPYNLLPHLYWLTEPDYDTEKHVAFMDLKPRIFDAKIFTEEGACTTDVSSSSCIHPNGWGTVMVVGMRFGGGFIQADTDMDNTKLDASNADEPIARSAFVVMDITNPEQPPTILGELAFSDLGFTTSYPTVALFRDRGDLSPAPATATNEWYLVLGSGPFDSSSEGPRGAALDDGTSDQPAKVYMVDLKELVQNGTVAVVNSSGATVSGGSIAAFASLDSDSFVSDPVTADFNLDYRADAVYFGTVSGDFISGWGGKLRRLVFENDDDPATWVNDSTLIDLNGVSDGQPITAAPTIALSKNSQTDDRWIYFGTGRFFNRNDVNNLLTADDDQTYYGIKEPLDTASPPAFTWGTVTNASLLDTTNARVFEDGFTVYTDYTNSSTKTTFNELVERMKIQNPSTSGFVNGWRSDLTDARERNIGQAALLGDVLTFTTYMPATDACEIEGTGNLYAVYYTTGTAYKKSIFGLGTNTVTEDRDGDGSNETTVKEVLRKMFIGRGMTLTPNLHVGRGKGSKAFIQTSTGGILGFGQNAPGATKSGVISWEVE